MLMINGERILFQTSLTGKYQDIIGRLGRQAGVRCCRVHSGEQCVDAGLFPLSVDKSVSRYTAFSLNKSHDMISSLRTARPGKFNLEEVHKQPLKISTFVSPALQSRLPT